MSVKHSSIFFCCVGPTGSGKNTVINRILDDGPKNLKELTTMTSREMRDNEQEGVDYFFISKDDFEDKINKSYFFEYEKVHNNYYGTPLEQITNAQQNGYDLIFDIDINGALKFKKQYPTDTVIIFIVPPSKDELISRINSRSILSLDEVETRLNTAKKEYQIFLDKIDCFDYFLTNVDVNETFLKVRSITYAERNRISRLYKEQIECICQI